MHVMAFTAMHSFPTSLTSLHCGLRLGVVGEYFLCQSFQNVTNVMLICLFVYLIFVHSIMRRFTEFGGTIHQRPVQDLAFAVARFIQKGGSYINYYMVSYHVYFGL